MTPSKASNMAQKAPGKNHWKGITLLELAQRFPTEEAAVKWLEGVVWPTERACGHCGSTRTTEASHAKMPYWCSDCRSYFSVRTGTLMERSKVPIQKWVYAIYLDVTSQKGVAAMKLHRDIGVSYKTAWFLLHRIREAFSDTGPIVMDGPVEVDETYVGGLEKNRHAKDRKNLGREPVGPQRDVPPAVGEAPATVRERVLRAAQHPGPGHDPADGARGSADGRESAHVPGSDRRHRPRVWSALGVPDRGPHRLKTRAT